MAEMQNVSGVLFAIRGGQLITARTQKQTDRVVIIGQALDGPVNVPYMVERVSDATKLFGPVFYEDISYVRDTSGNTMPASAASGAVGKFTGNRLIRALHEVVQGGATDIILIRVGGVVAAGTLTGSGSATITMEAVYPGSIYNGTTVIWSSGGVTVQFVNGKAPSTATNNTVSFSVAGKTVEQVCNEINDYRGNGSIRLYPSNVAAGLSASGFAATATVSGALSGGRNGTIDGLYPDAPGSNAYEKNSYILGCLTAEATGTFAVLEDIPADIFLMAALNFDEGVNPASGGIYAGGPSFTAGSLTIGNIGYSFGRFLHDKSKSGFPAMGVVGLRPFVVGNPDVRDIAKIVENLTSGTTGYFDIGSRVITQPPSALCWIKPGWFLTPGVLDYTDPSEPPGSNIIPLGRYLSVVAGPDIIFTIKGVSYVGNGAGLYAGMASSCPIQEALTGKPLPGVTALTYRLSRRQVNMLAAGQPYDEVKSNNDSLYGGGGYVVFRNVPDQGLITNYAVNSDVTAGPRNDQFADLFTWRIVAAISNEVRAAVYPFIGKENTIETRMAMNTAVRGILEKASQMGVLMPGENVGYNFSITSSTVDQIVGRVTIELRIRPVFQIRQIRVVVSVAR
jgi:hypothetical protein